MNPDLGNITLALVFRDLVTDGAGNPVLDERRRKQFVERRVTKGGCGFELTKTTEKESNTDISTAHGRAFLPWDADTFALTESDALEHMGRLYELSGPVHPWLDLDGDPDHLQVTCEWNGG